jgi:hypothetical protein
VRPALFTAQGLTALATALPPALPSAAPAGIVSVDASTPTVTPRASAGWVEALKGPLRLVLKAERVWAT